MLQTVFSLPREHQRQRLVRPVLAGAQMCDGRWVQRIAHQVIAADPLYRDGLAAAQGRDASLQCRFAPGIPVGRDETQLRPALRAGQRLRVEAAVVRVFDIRPGTPRTAENPPSWCSACRKASRVISV